MRQDVVHLIAGRLPATIELTLLSLAIALFLGIGVAGLTTLARGRMLGAAVDNFNGVMLAVPDFVWALSFVVVSASCCRSCRFRDASTLACPWTLPPGSC